MFRKLLFLYLDYSQGSQPIYRLTEFGEGSKEIVLYEGSDKGTFNHSLTAFGIEWDLQNNGDSVKPVYRTTSGDYVRIRQINSDRTIFDI